MQTDHVAIYANQLLSDLGCCETVNALSDHPALAWQRSGLLEATGLSLPLPLASHADGALMALQALSPKADLPKSGALLLGERARLRETKRAGRYSAGGYGRLMDTADGRIALNLVREDDWDLIPAWLEDYAADWDEIAEIVLSKETDFLVIRAAELGLAAAKDALPERQKKWFSSEQFAHGSVPQNPLVVDLSGLWAGPLASSLLMMTGARVIKVESPKRPDGMRLGHKGFYELLNAGKDCVALDFHDAGDLRKLKQLLGQADVVIEASRPRALRQLGIIAETFVSQKPGKIWARLTAYGQSENRIGFGDDIGISAGLASVMEQAHGEPCFVGDAIADPINGLHFALAIQAKLMQGGGTVIDMTMQDVLRYAMGDIDQPVNNIGVEDVDKRAQLYDMRQPVGISKPLGADNAAWL